MANMIYTRPEPIDTWARTGLTTPLPDAAIEAGWGNTFVGQTAPLEEWNFIYNYLWSNLHYALQRGVALEWDSSEEYPQYAICLATDGNFYLALQANSNQEPSISPDYWEKWSISQAEFETFLDNYIKLVEKNNSNGIAGLDNMGKIDQIKLPMGTDISNGTFKIDNDTITATNGILQKTSGDAVISYTTNQEILPEVLSNRLLASVGSELNTNSVRRNIFTLEPYDLSILPFDLGYPTLTIAEYYIDVSSWTPISSNPYVLLAKTEFFSVLLKAGANETQSVRSQIVEAYLTTLSSNSSGDPRDPAYFITDFDISAIAPGVNEITIPGFIGSYYIQVDQSAFPSGATNATLYLKAILTPFPR